MIVAIPVAAVWFLASRFAKWLMTAISAGSATWTTIQTVSSPEFGPDHMPWLFAALAMHSLVLLLFTPSARRWFASQRTRDAKASE